MVLHKLALHTSPSYNFWNKVIYVNMLSASPLQGTNVPCMVMTLADRLREHLFLAIRLPGLSVLTAEIKLLSRNKQGGVERRLKMETSVYCCQFDSLILSFLGFCNGILVNDFPLLS